MIDFKIQVTPEQSKIVQEILFGYGIYWVSRTRSIICLDAPYLFVENGKISQCSKRQRDYFENHRLPEITLNEFFAEYAFYKLLNLL